MVGCLSLESLQWQQSTSASRTMKQQCILLLQTHTVSSNIFSCLHSRLPACSIDLEMADRVTSFHWQVDQSILRAQRLAEATSAKMTMRQQIKTHQRKYIGMLFIYNIFMDFKLRHHIAIKEAFLQDGHIVGGCWGWPH